MKRRFVAALLWAGVCTCTVLAQNTPRIQFEKSVYDFGKVSNAQSVSGTFKFKNTGDGVLKIEQPKPACGCTLATLKPDTLRPGETGELPFTLNLGRVKANLEKRIAVKSNDPTTPEVFLTIKAEYVPLYDVSPTALSPMLLPGAEEVVHHATMRRTDGKPIGPLRFSISKPWIRAKVDPEPKPEDTTARIQIQVARGGPLGRFSESVMIYTAEDATTPASTIFLSGQVRGELSLSPEALYWTITDSPKAQAERAEVLLTRRVVVRSANGKEFEVKNPKASIDGMQVELVSKEGGKVYEVVAKLATVPDKTIRGDISFETSVPTQAKVSFPVIVSVFKTTKSL